MFRKMGVLPQMTCGLCEKVVEKTASRQRWCQECRQEGVRLHSREYKEAHREEARAHSKRGTRTLRLKVLEKFGSVCRICGYKDDLRALAIDHVKGGGHQEKMRLGTNYYLHLLNNGTHENYQTLCYNCNAIKGRAVR